MQLTFWVEALNLENIIACYIRFPLTGIQSLDQTLKKQPGAKSSQKYAEKAV